MPSLTEVLDANLGGQFLINFNSNRLAEGTPLATLLDTPAYRDQIFGVYGGTRPTQAAIAALEDLRGYDKAGLKQCLIRYALTGWSGIVPKVCHNMIIAVPMDYGHYLWGWPHVFTNRMKAAGTTVLLLGPYDGSGFSSGVDDAKTWAQIPARFDGYVWTNRIEIIGPLHNQ
jgi:glycerophosphoryl diester phosphodiesterase